MNALMKIADQPLSMTSREVAELTGKEHSNVMRDIRALVDAIQMDSNLNPCAKSTTYIGKDGRQYPQYELDKDTCLTLLLGYDPVARMKVVKRWQELEAQQQPMLNPVNLSRMQLIEMAMQAEQERIQLECQVQALAPKAAAHDRIADAEGSISVRETANTLRVPERKFVLWLLQNGWCYRRSGHKSLLAYADKVPDGLLYLKQTPIIDVHSGQERLSEQVRVTPLGLTVLAKKLADSIHAQLEGAM